MQKMSKYKGIQPGTLEMLTTVRDALKFCLDVKNTLLLLRNMFSSFQVMAYHYFKSWKRSLKITLKTFTFLWANSNSSQVQVFKSFMRNTFHLTNYFFRNRLNGKIFIIIYYQISLFCIYLLCISFSHYIILSPRARVYWC